MTLAARCSRACSKAGGQVSQAQRMALRVHQNVGMPVQHPGQALGLAQRQAPEGGVVGQMQVQQVGLEVGQQPPELAPEAQRNGRIDPLGLYRHPCQPEGVVCPRLTMHQGPCIDALAALFLHQIGQEGLHASEIGWKEFADVKNASRHAPCPVTPCWTACTLARNPVGLAWGQSLRIADFTGLVSAR
jgi:hypothetical protein